MTMCPELTPCFSERTQLNSLRYAFTVACNMFVTATIWLLLASAKPKDGAKHTPGDGVSADDQPVFTKLAIAVSILGFAASFWFHYGMWVHARQKRLAAGPAASRSEARGGVDSAEVAGALLGPEEAEEAGLLVDSGEMECEGGVEEPPSTPRAVAVAGVAHDHFRQPHSVGEASDERVTLAQWFRMPELYTVTMLYMCSRLLLNMSQVYLPLYLQGGSSALKLPKDSIAQVPLVLYLASLAATPFLKYANQRLGRQTVMVLSLAVSGFSSLCWMFIPAATTENVNGPLVPVLFAAAALGWSSSCAMVTSLSMAADVIGEKTASSAVIYGFLSFTDKLSSGIAIMAVQSGDPCPNANPGDWEDYDDSGPNVTRLSYFRPGLMRVLLQNGTDSPLLAPPPPAPPGAAMCDKASNYYRDVMTYVPGVAALVALATLAATSVLSRRRVRAAQRKADLGLLDGIEDISAPLLGLDDIEEEEVLVAHFASPPKGTPRAALPL